VFSPGLQLPSPSLLVFADYLPRASGWTTAFVSPVFEWNHEDPTVVATLTYWTASAMGLPGTWDMPEVGAETAYSTSGLWYYVMGQAAKIPGAKTLSLNLEAKNDQLLTWFAFYTGS
jgi:hypothetical protein